MKRRFLISPPRRDNGTLLPAALLALLVAMLLFQLFASNAPPLPELPGGMPARPASLDLPRPAPAAVPPVILARTLFSPTRGPAGSADAGSAAPVGGAVPVGTIGRGRARILFLKTSDGRVIRMGRGGSHQGWTLVAIESDGVTFAREGQKIRVNFGATPVMPATTSAAGGDDDEREEE